MSLIDKLDLGLPEKDEQSLLDVLLDRATNNYAVTGKPSSWGNDFNSGIELNVKVSEAGALVSKTFIHENTIHTKAVRLAA